MIEQNSIKILFIVNPASGKQTINWPLLIADYFKPLNHSIEIFVLPKEYIKYLIIQKIIEFSPQKVVAVGGDGTVKMVAECLLQTKIVLGILPAGSANGLAKELGINENPKDALDVLVNGVFKKIHAININGHLCIHLSDIGLNAFAIKMFEKQSRRGMWGYFLASLKALWKSQTMKVSLQMDDKTVDLKAAIVVMANATKYGSGAAINPIGKLDDDLFEVVAVKKISFLELFKMAVSHAPFDEEKTEVFQTKTLSVKTTKNVHFQVDGEYLGKLKEVNASLLKDALEIIVPENLNGA